MINKHEVLLAAQKHALLPSTIEKDYVLSWILLGISSHPQLSKEWIFKGGTCIKKCYIRSYRFSEDLDFTVKNKNYIELPLLYSTFIEVLSWVTKQIGIQVFLESLKFEKHRERGGYVSVQGSFSYQGPLMMQGKNKPKVKLDLTSDEILTRPPKKTEILHDYSDRDLFLDKEIRCYSFEELFAEKMRALVERMRPRDLYDVIHLFQLKEDINSELFIQSLKKKCIYKNVAFPTFSLLESHPSRSTLGTSWKHMLGHQISPLPTLDYFWSQLPRVFNWMNYGLESTLKS